MLEEKFLKKVYRVVSEEIFNDRKYTQFREESRLHYGIPEMTPVKDDRFTYDAEEHSYTRTITKYDEFMEAVKDGEVRAHEFQVKRSIFGKKYVYMVDRFDSYMIQERWFTRYVQRKYIKNAYPDIEMLRKELPAEEYIEWCKDHGIDLVERALLNL